MLILLFAAAASAPSAPAPLIPIGSLITSSDYPAGAMQEGTTGTVGFRLRVDATGKPDGCVVSKTSGSAALDNATCDLMLARARFKPAHGPGGKPTRGDYSAKVAWSLEDELESVTSEVVRLRSELDGAGKMTSCTATPADKANDFGGCALFGDVRMLGHLVGRPLTEFVWIEMRIIKQASADAPVADDVPPGAVKRVLARSTVTITPAGAIGGCTNDVVTQFDGRSIDLCAIGIEASDTKFTPNATSERRQLIVTMETISQSR